MDDDKRKDNNEEEELEQDGEGTMVEEEETSEESHSDYKPADRFDASAVKHLSGMYKNWFLTMPAM